jgi:hypothetical protein
MFLSKNTINAYQELFFDIAIILTFILFFLYFFSISHKAKNYLDLVNNIIIIYISLFLLYRFNPFKKKYDFTNLDRKIAFSAGVFIFSSTFFGIVLF